MNYISQLNAFWQKVHENSSLKPTSITIYMALMNINNMCGWKEEFSVTYGEVLSFTGIASVKTYYSAVQELVDGGYLTYIKGPNQYVAAKFKIKMLYQNLPKHMEEHIPKHMEEQVQSTYLSTGNILKQETIKQETINNKERVVKNKFSPPSKMDVENYFKEKMKDSEWSEFKSIAEAKTFFNFYESKNWMVGKNKMSNWKSAISGWINRSNNNFKNNSNGKSDPKHNPTAKNFGRL